MTEPTTIELCLPIDDDVWADPVEARGYVFPVVAVKRPGHWILRGIRGWRTHEQIVERMKPYVALFPAAELEWTFATYRIPAYMGDLMDARPYVGGLYLYRVTSGEEPDVAPNWMKEDNRSYRRVEKLADW